MNKRNNILLGLLLFNSVSAIGGGIALINGTINQLEWVVHTGFASLFFPGVILAAIVGGSSLIAALALQKKATGWQLACITAAIIMLFWIVLEVVSIRAFHFLQIVYFVTGILVILLTPKTE